MKIVISDTPPHFLDLDAPTLPAFAVHVRGQDLWRVWCVHCRRWHEHAPGDGHRLTHCDVPGGPYAGHGYNLALADNVSAGNRAQ